MYTKEYNDGAEERGSEDVSESENAGVRTLKQDNGHTYKLVEFIQPQTQTTELDLPASTQVDPLCATAPAMMTEILLRNVRVNAIADHVEAIPLSRLALSLSIPNRLYQAAGGCCIANLSSPDGFSLSPGLHGRLLQEEKRACR
jgi:hypothetical protein